MKNTRTVRQFLFLIFVRPLFPLGQWLVMRFGIVKGPHSFNSRGRQPFLIGMITGETSRDTLRSHLLIQGFYDNRVAYNDPGQTLSMRKLDDAHPTFQYHLRAFSDGEVRGHYEWTPEDNFRAHLGEEVLMPRTDEFVGWCGDLIQNTSRSSPDE